ncbi:type 1 glutamine amidotransferase [Pseudopelagicola sp. nBUS_19]|uniref:type 1 glutamine amidotransferase n=1 Tax=Pseudopelagicola sp. nBUS_19 TaxID=3395316 RepID=UPI003EC1512F
MNILVLQHAKVEHPGIFRSYLVEDGHSYDAVEIDEGEPLPELDQYEALWVMGGPMDVWQEDIYPWLIEEKAFIHEAVKVRGLPFLGLCLGHQLLADALGGTVGPSSTPEVGVMDVQLTQAGATGVLFDGFEDRFACLQWHGAEVKQMPAGGQCLATSPDCTVQAMRWGTRAFSAQFHIEVEADTVSSWSAIPEYAASLENALGQDGARVLGSDVSIALKKFNAMAERFYINWLQTAAKT